MRTNTRKFPNTFHDLTMQKKNHCGKTHTRQSPPQITRMDILKTFCNFSPEFHLKSIFGKNTRNVLTGNGFHSRNFDRNTSSWMRGEAPLREIFRPFCMGKFSPGNSIWKDTNTSSNENTNKPSADATNLLFNYVSPLSKLFPLFFIQHAFVAI